LAWISQSNNSEIHPAVPETNQRRQGSHVEEEFEIPGSPHEHAVEEATEKEGRGLNQKIALMTAILATIGALISYQSGSAQNEAMFLKNESILKQAEASDQWAFYQAKSMKGHVAEATAALATDPAIKARFTEEKARQDKEKAEVQIEAKKLFIQIAIALAAITVLTQRRWLLWGAVGSAGIGIFTAISAFFLH
jgi:hypothetical protein